MHDLRDNVKAICAAKALVGGKPSTMGELAELLGVDRGALSKMLSGRRGHIKPGLVDVAAALGVTVDRVVWWVAS